MKDAELRDLINEVGQITGKTMILDPRLNGKVTVCLLYTSPSPRD